MGWDSGTVVFRDSCDYGEPSPGQTFIGWFAGNVTSEKIEALNRNTDAGNRGEWNIGEEAIYHVLRRRLHQSSRDPDLPRYELAPHLLLVPFDTHDQFLVEHAQAVASLLDLCGRSTS